MMNASERQKIVRANQRKCNGTSRRTGLPCQDIAMKNGKCRIHGGKVKGAPKGNKNAVKEGAVYSKYKTPEQLALINKMKLEGTLTSLLEEIAATKIRLQAAIEAQDKATLEGRLDDLKLIQSVETDGGQTNTQRTYKPMDHDAIVDRLTARVQSLAKTHSELEQVKNKADNTLIIVGGLPDIIDTSVEVEEDAED